MTSIPFFQVDAFAPAPLTGNPAAVMPLDHWLDDALMQSIAAENNLSETAFTVPSDREDADYDLRWFTPASEVDLCGHATIATGHVLVTGRPLRFATRSGILTVTRRDGLLELDLPAAKLTEGREPELCAALGIPDQPVWLAEGCNDAAIVELEDEAAVRALAPDMAILARVPRMAVVTARGSDHAIASRVFVPYLGIDEDPVTGSAHAALVPYWAKTLGRAHFTALQASKRTGVLDCRLEGARVVLGGQCRTVIVGQFQL
ncbi:PhzF family phenazine biosynthesis protein [Sphingomonas sp.]|uniref:PhzF family phenazine biosynthesis protein n=1 Tax=Sphingomonas sp. TaxID=28214 RepID=UPI0025D54E43|nr:PhzF family phenazine biosynthesis protein [Sphingomonas sp.]MBV9528219.1 PhzF family phenazine biosynthesis protein [Sphingomonas sp.]